MAIIHPDYPHKRTDKQIKESIKEYTKEIYDAKGQINTSMVFSPLIQLGENELQTRQTKRVTRLTIGVSAISILIALISLWIANQSSRSNDIWKSEQIVKLDEMISEMEAQSLELESQTKSIELQTHTVKDLMDSTYTLLVEIKKEIKNKKQPTTKPKAN